MNDELCQRLFAKHIIHIIILMLLQLGQYESKFQTTAQRRIYPLVPDEEVSALNAVAGSLGFNGLNMFSSILCSDRSTSDGAGIICNCNFDNNTNCHVERLLWSNKGLKGSLPQEVANLTYLQKLDLSDNKIQGRIPASLGTMTKLYDLDLSNNQLIETIPRSLGNLKAQVTLSGTNSGAPERGPCPSFNLDLSSNSLEGLIPSDLGSITVDLTNKEGKNVEKNLSCKDFSISLHDNHLTGSIPKSLGKLNFLTTLSLSENQLNGSLPSELANLTSLRSLYLQSNNFIGELPDNFGQLSNLNEFSISGNYFSGLFPQFIMNWTSVNILSFYGNNFAGNIPPGIFNITSLNSLMISDVGTSPFLFPESANIFHINTLVMRNCSIIGPIPPYIGINMTSLKYLDLSFNNLTGEIPIALENLTLNYMSFANNSLVGLIPAWISRAANWTQIDLSYNDFSGTKYLSLEPQLTLQRRNSNLNLFSCCRSCNLSSTCTPEMKGVDQLRNIYCPFDDGKPKYNTLYINCGGEEIELDKNRYDQDDSTLLPYGVSQNGTNYWAFSSSGSFLSTDSNSSDNIKNSKCGIPIADAPLYSNARLAPVSLMYYGFCLRRGSYNVTLYFAEIVYTRDNTEHSDSKKRIFDIYIQDMRVISNFHVNSIVNERGKVSISSVEVENGILKILLYWAGKGSSGNPPDFNGPLLSAIAVTPDFDECASTYYGSFTCRPIIKVIFIGIGSGIGAVLLLLGSWGTYKLVKKRRKIQLKKKFFKRNGGLLLQQQLSSGEVNIEKTKLFNSKELEKATDSFNTDRVLGQGGQGTVYKGMLVDGKIVAIKKSKIDNERKITEFINEVVILSQINHRNIVKLLGCCLETEVPLLVYEFIPNGTLSQYIYDEQEEFPLTWEIRLRIATELAGALSYLHTSASLPIYHRDIKSTNILLDGKYRAKVADFGTSRSVAIEQTHLTTQVYGTFGYLDPEYFLSSQLTDKSDVYSFGVVLVELLTGQRPISDQRTEQGINLATYFKQSIEEDKLFDIVDARVMEEGKREAIIAFAELAKRCLNSKGRRRPTMKEVAAALVDIQKSQKGSGADEENVEEVEYAGEIVEHPWDLFASSTCPAAFGDPTCSSSVELPLFSNVSV